MKIAVLLSGGVDSSVALHQIKNLGYSDITAYYLKVWLEEDLAFIGNCPWEDDLSAARAVCEQAGVALRILSLQLEYYDVIVTYLLDELRQGRTPSPDIFCNQRIKFGAFFHALHEDFDLVVTGHYAQVKEGKNGRYHLFQAPDPVKDQTYFLSHLNQHQLSKIYFPLGRLHKTEVRKIAQDLDLPNKNRHDSQGICFLGKISYPQFLHHYLGKNSGNIIQREGGKILGTHDGFWFYTIGQRTGLGLSAGPWYVVDKNCEENIVYVSHQKDIDMAFYDSVRCINPSWIAGNEPVDLFQQEDFTGSFRLKLRHGPKMIPCFAQLLNDSERRFIVRMAEGDKGLAPGQFAVFYHDDECLGGAMIEGALRSSVPASSTTGSPV